MKFCDMLWCTNPRTNCDCLKIMDCLDSYNIHKIKRYNITESVSIP